MAARYDPVNLCHLIDDMYERRGEQQWQLAYTNAIFNQDSEDLSEDDEVVALLAPYRRDALTATRQPNIHQSGLLLSHHLSPRCQGARVSERSYLSMDATAGQAHTSILSCV